MSIYLVQKRLAKSLLVSLCLFSSTWGMAAVREYRLTIDEGMVNVIGKPLKRITVNGQFPAPLLEFEEGDDAVIRVTNKLKNQDSSVHWHGLLLPGIMDGVPGFNGFNGIKPNEEYVYKFKVRQSGTYWYHAHSKGQEQDGLYGSLVIYPKDRKPLAAHERTERDYVVMLSDFHKQTSDQIQNNLKVSAEYYQNRRETVFDVWKQIQRDGLKTTWSDRKMWNQMRMLKTDMSDVTGYTFLVNGKTPEQNWTGMFKPNEKVRLRFVNASAMSFFDVRIPHLKMTVVSADGQPVKPVAVDEFRIGTAETYDVIVEPKGNHYQIEAESIDRSGFAIGTLHNELMPKASGIHMPNARPRSLLTMEDMGMDHSSMGGGSMQGMDHSKMSTDSMQGMDHSKMSANSMQGMDHSKMSADGMQGKDHSKMSADSMQGMDHSKMSNDSMQGMDHSKMSADSMQGMDHSKMSADSMQGMDHSKMNADSMQGMDHSQHDQASKSKNDQVVYGWANASTPQGDKALQYSDLKSLTPQPDTREATSELVVRLGGTMERYVWTINGKKFSEAEPLKVKYGERIRIKFINDSMMAHPMHLHGMFMQLENGQPPVDMPNKHTVVVPPGKTVTALLTADELGEWAIHCHLLYHMTSGMMNKLIVANVSDGKVSTQPIQATKADQKTEMKGGEHANH
ncbi:multicopper oxidase domain-containing protein [Acinetobacter bereziniae]|uniref:multicopper oxidase domain-containing protein n=1 Tax=Acinetobacter bereziniae TaxID=106648 RepID=UPI00157FE0AC|nr:multicopper oxidase domain-containing protein [Acinetobacter bereziniae]NUF62146.1 multicopper oxidase domain-containing protein [Acinetobacter bereziniae]NUG05910.1 multicopper oxidase domain-containing protein [Acinetobacter bereziniae]NUG62181.1 multicopper oxidase domain-containing protein [Acinetobacter bereziniae]NUG68158.1 multicopper oxidase domain-containing protein [Acinetobacter bereziniae]NUG79570.1 multicopper oxidase domain-containing protein [Acinetobacter bereziniae]